MWFVYNKEDSWQCGWAVANRREAERQCAHNPDLRCIYIG